MGTDESKINSAPGKLYVVGTPIGNLSDFSPRAVQTLSDVDFIAAEDTRVTAKLLNHFGIKKPSISYHEHNCREKGELIINRILNNESCALVSDAGMPAISDPGESLVNSCHERGITVVCVPSATAFASALAVSGMPSGRFTFEGFLSVNKRSRREHLQAIVNEERTLIFYEAPHKLAATLADLARELGDREITIVREITKLHEEIIKTTLCAAAREYASKSLRGEIVLIVAGKPKAQGSEFSLTDAVQMAKKLVLSGLSINDAAKEAAHATKLRKSEIYKNLLLTKED